jgi:hypothetical protein
MFNEIRTTIITEVDTFNDDGNTNTSTTFDKLNMPITSKTAGKCRLVWHYTGGQRVLIFGFNSVRVN